MAEENREKIALNAINKNFEIYNKRKIHIEMKRIRRKKLMFKELVTDEPLFPLK